MASFFPQNWPHIDFLGLQLFGKTRKDFLCTIVHSHFDMLSLFFRGCPLNRFKVELSPYKMTISKCVADEDCVGNNLLQIWKLSFGQKDKLLFRP